MRTAQFWRRSGVALIELPAVIAWYSEGHSAPLAMTFTGVFWLRDKDKQARRRADDDPL